MGTTAAVGTDNATFFESIYAEAHGDAARVPWADRRAHPALVTWLNAIAPSILRCGSRVAVVGCGLGDDAREITNRGYEVLAFDVSPTAIEWCHRIDPEHADMYVNADLFDPPARWRHRFDLVVEINTLQALPPERRPDAMGAITELVSAHGHLLVITRGTNDPNASVDGPPWPITEHDLCRDASLAGLAPEGAVSSFMDDEDPPVHRIRALFKRA